MQRHKDEPLWLSIAAGAVGGLVASFAMNQFHAAAEAISKSVEGPNPRQQAAKGEDATVKTAEAISEKALDHDLSEDEKQRAGPSIHYALGMALGAAYGALAPVVPVAAGAGTLYGTAVWLGADEVTVPALGLSEPPSQRPLSEHVKELGAHLVFGLVTHYVRRLLLMLAD